MNKWIRKVIVINLRNNVNAVVGVVLRLDGEPVERINLKIGIS